MMNQSNASKNWGGWRNCHGGAFPKGRACVRNARVTLALAALAVATALAPTASAQSLTLSPSTLTFSFPGGRPAISTKTVTLKNNTDNFPQQWTSSFFADSPSLRSAFSLSPSSGTVPSSGMVTLTVSVDESKFPPNGTFRATLFINNPNYTLTTEITVQTTATSSIALSPDSLNLSRPFGDSELAEATVTISSAGGFHGFAATLEAETDDLGGGWLSVFPHEVTVSGANGSAEFQVRASAGSINKPGRYTGHIRVTSPGAVNSPRLLSVVFEVTPASPLKLDQKVAVRDSGMRLNIQGDNFNAETVLDFLKADGTPDSELLVSAINVVSATEIQADLFVNADAVLGPRTLRVTTGTDLTLPNALNVVRVSLAFRQGAKTTLTADRLANHPTVVRAYVEATTNEPGLSDGVTGLLYVFNGTTQIPGSPFAPKYPRPNFLYEGIKEVLSDQLVPLQSVAGAVTMYGLQDSLNFYFGTGGAPQLPEGQFSFALVVNPNAPKIPPQPLANNLSKEEVKAHRESIYFEELQVQDFITTKPLSILIVADPRLSDAQASALFNRNQSSQQFLRGIFPIDGTKVRMQTLQLDEEFIDIDALGSFFTSVGAHRILHRLSDVLDGINRLAPTPDRQYDRIVLILRTEDILTLSGHSYQGVSIPRVFPSVMAGEDEPVMAHELAHTFGLFDTYPTNFLKNLGSPNPRRSDALLTGNRVELGTEALVPAFVQGVPALGASASADSIAVLSTVGAVLHFQKVSFMGSGVSGDSWIDLVEWKHLYNKFRLPQQGALKEADARKAKAVGADLLTVRGLLDTAGNVTEVTVNRGAVVSTLADPEPGEFTLELLDGAGQVLSQGSFGVNFVQPHLGLLTLAPFSASVPFAPGAAQVRIRNGDNVLFSQAISPNPPTVQVLSPQGGETLDGSFTIRWNAGDPDGDPLTYSVFYLREGTTPIPIADNLTSTSFQWTDPTRNGGGSGAQIIVVADDGANEAVGTSGPFTVSKRPPAVTIFSPKNGVSIPAGTETVLSGAGSDAEEGSLPSNALSFRSSIDGEFGPGATNPRTLSKGVHTITLTGFDSEGNAAESSVSVTVGDASDVPVIDRITPDTGAANATVTLSGRNFAPGSIVQFGTSTASVVTASSRDIIVKVPAGLPLGDIKVAVSSGGHTSETFAFDVINGRPLLASVNPNTGSPGTPVSIIGAEFDPTAAGNTVNFGGIPATILGGDKNNVLVTVPAGLSQGPVNVTVASAQGTSDSLPFTITAGPPATPVVLDSISPSSGPAGTIVTINGTGFSQALHKNAVGFGNIAVRPISVSGNALQAIVPFELSAGTSSVTVSVNGYPSNPLPFTVSSGTNPTPTPGCGTPGKIAFTSTRDGNNEIYLMNPDGSEQTRLTNNPALDYTPGWSPDGSKIVFSSDRDGNGEIYVMNADGSGQTRLTNNLAPDYFPAWSPDGARIAFTRQMTGTNLEIFVMNANGTGEVNITNSPTNDQMPAWSPNGTRLAFASDRDAPTLELYTMNVDGSGITRLTNNPNGIDYYPAWSPDGTKIAFTTDRVSNPHSYDFALEVFVMNADGTNQTNLTNHGRGDLNPAWAPDGSRIIFASDRATAQYVPQLYSMNSNGTDVIRLTNTAATDVLPAWSAAQCNPTPAAVREVQNISTRVVVGTGENVAIGGFIILGNGSKRVIVRAIGPSLATFGVTGSLEDPTLELFNGSGNAIAFNDDWPGSSQNQEIAAILPPSDSVEAAIIAALTPGNYTAVLRGYENGTGIALVEVYDLDQGAPSRLANISTRGSVGTGGSVLIGGFIVGKEGDFVIRAIGPSLAAAGIANALGDPLLELYNAQGVQFATNDNWQENPSAHLISGLGIAPTNPLESALIYTLAAGNYTAIVRGVNDDVGVGLVEVYNIQ